MENLGDITKINGALIELVDVIVGGSPCQDLSVAGKRAGLEGGRSGLFMEQIRIVREQRNESIKRADDLIRPRYVVWENVPGAFSSNKAEDFRIVLEETARIADSNAAIPRPPKNKWATAGCIMGDGWSIAWRVQDAQFWGVPQRRRRIALVADFGGLTAPEILFERKGVSGDITESGTEREGAAGDVEGSINPSVARSLTRRHDGSPCIDRGPEVILQPLGFSYKASAGAGTIGCADNLAPSLLGARHDAAICFGIGGFNSEGMLSPNPHAGIYEADTSRTLDLNGGNPACNQGGIAVDARMSAFGQYETDETFSAMKQRDYKDATDLIINNLAVRRLTPLECERLQGYPDGWTDIIFRNKPASDSARYKALGNSIALPPWRFVLGRIYQHGARTLGSLFDGIGGFPLIWSELGGETLWASEIEPFPIAVTTIRFGI